jgi:transcriptional regulator
MTLHEIADLTKEIAAEIGGDCTRQNISLIEQRALRKVRVWLYQHKDVWRDLQAHLKGDHAASGNGSRIL